MKAEKRVCRCVRCGYVWTPRVEGRPRGCPACKSYRWDEAKRK